MAHTFKSLLITSVLTLPSIFAANELDVVAAAGAHSAGVAAVPVAALPGTTPEGLRKEGNELFKSGQRDRAAELFEKSANLSDATPIDIRQAAFGMRGLGSDFHDRTAALYEKSANHPSATQLDRKMAVVALIHLGVDFYARAVVVCEQIANHPDAEPQDRQLAIDEIRTIANQYVEGSSERARYHALADAISAK
ncbi:hypothetical protein [Candidatus Bodocaedibacter vickermanii]|uniref:Tetratricopeptide repeat-containing protein n=1 Tax=Candidatus Bodocaedibacter vickermanii TaxID=2741701 RepID=A0A7L9RUX9_9PROT|nr:hypothetical protein CPBP_01211 [Candidatus Paracaedibacteraceae bacterium 'Lake Konstanz']